MRVVATLLSWTDGIHQFRTWCCLIYILSSNSCIQIVGCHMGTRKNRQVLSSFYVELAVSNKKVGLGIMCIFI